MKNLMTWVIVLLVIGLSAKVTAAPGDFTCNVLGSKGTASDTFTGSGALRFQGYLYGWHKRQLATHILGTQKTHLATSPSPGTTPGPGNRVTYSCRVELKGGKFVTTTFTSNTGTSPGTTVSVD